RQDAKAILLKVRSIKENPYAHVRRLKGTPLFRLRAGKYRIIIYLEKETIFVVNIGKRDSVYDAL
ncbi:MAG: type II toxin-antitoxin system RelE/ParE family toxin, partial [Candidatus Omnitrophota bacterium]